LPLEIRGSGPNGRIVLNDVDRITSEFQLGAARSAPQPGSARQPPTPFAPATHSPADAASTAEQASPGIVVSVPSPARIGHDLPEPATPSNLLIECRIDALLEHRRLTNLRARETGDKLTPLTAYFVRALGLALSDVPEANVLWQGRTGVRQTEAAIGLAMAVGGGVVVPVIKSAESRTPYRIAEQIAFLAEELRLGTLPEQAFEGGATSIANLGPIGVKRFDAVVHPPRSTVLAIGSAEKRPFVAGNAVEVATILTCTLSCDPRLVNGAVGGRLLAAFRRKLESPESMEG